MLRLVFLGLLAATMCSFISAASAPQITRFNRQEGSPHPSSEEDPTIRSERSTNLSFITGTARKIRMYIKNRHLQLLPDGIVNGTSDDHNAYTILQRTTVGIGQLKIQGVATCQYLCMDICGLLYGSKEFGDECVFNEMMEQHHYNTYSSTKYSNDKRTLYLALNRKGQPRKVMLRANQQLGRLSSYTRVLTRAVSPESAEEFHPLRHHSHSCTVSPSIPAASSPAADSQTDSPRCRKKKKRKKKKRKCLEGEAESELCQKRPHTPHNNRKTQVRLNNNDSNKKCEFEDSDECQRVEVTNKKRHNNKLGDKLTLHGTKKRKKIPKNVKNKKARVITTTEALVTDEVPSDEDYTMETTTAWDFEDSTTMPDEFSTPHPD
uniref:Fibroblast growth factor n=1 Tax=Photinus pyralis TaxID=7054 RepID=A0A1Y1JRL0_PHOPY